MIVCPNCNHQNPDAAIQCEACYTPLPEMINCPNCGVSVQADASFCGQCGFNLQGAAVNAANPASSASAPEASFPDLPPLDPLPLEPLIEPEPLVASVAPPSVSPPAANPQPAPPVPNAQPEVSPPHSSLYRTQLQTHVARLLHVQTNTTIELPDNLAVIHLGKPNDRVPPDIDVSGFPNSEIVSRIHADIRVEGDLYYIEDVGSSNGTYINNAPLPTGNRHRLRAGDRIALGKGDKVTFLFQIA